MNRRSFVLGAAAAALALKLPPPAGALAATRPQVVVYKDPLCGCCDYWVDHIRDAGFPVVAHDTAEMAAIKARHGVPRALASCHTGLVDGYVLEGHVPAGAFERLLAERPQAIGLAVPGMPIGSPGMEVEGMPPDVYDVVLFGEGPPRHFARYRGGEALEP